MHDARPMRLGQAVGELRAEVEQIAQGKRTRPEPAPQRLALHQLHDNVVHAGAAGRLADVVDVDDVRVIERGGGARLPIQPVQQLGIRAGAEHLDRHRPAQPRIASAVDLAHAARAQTVDHLVGPDPRAGREGVFHATVPVRGRA